jgi:hypothetical protein
MLKGYNNYRRWYRNWDNSGTSFEDHINGMTLYELLDTLESWEDCIAE